MLRGYRSIVCALGGLVLASARLPTQQAAQPNQATSQSASKADIARIASALEQLQQAGDPDTGCERGRDDRKSDLCAQWKAADAAYESAAWTRRTFWLGIAAAVIGLFTLGAASFAAWWAKKAAEHTKTGATAATDTLEDARQNAAIQLRPYVAITEHPDDDAPTPFSRDSILKIRVVNFGQTPATNVRFSIGGAVAERPIGDYVVTLDKSGDYGVIAPGDCRTEKIHARDLTPADFGVIASGKDHMLARIRIDYTWPGGADHHDLTMILTDPATSEWNLLTDDRRRYTNDDK